MPRLLVLGVACLIAACPDPPPHPQGPRIDPQLPEPNTKWTVSAASGGGCVAQRQVACTQLQPCTPALPSAYECPAGVVMDKPITVATHDGYTCVIEFENG